MLAPAELPRCHAVFFLKAGRKIGCIAVADKLTDLLYAEVLPLEELFSRPLDAERHQIVRKGAAAFFMEEAAEIGRCNMIFVRKILGTDIRIAIIALQIRYRLLHNVLSARLPIPLEDQPDFFCHPEKPVTTSSPRER